ncbi:TPA: hypothetical protein ACGW13_000209 [Stenotrophomonas maltophilia]
MTTDNKTLAVDVLAVMDSASLSLFEVCRNADARSLDKARATVAELIEALRACDRRLHDLGFTVSDDVTAQVIHALARVKGESA